MTKIYSGYFKAGADGAVVGWTLEFPQYRIAGKSAPEVIKLLRLAISSACLAEDRPLPEPILSDDQEPGMYRMDVPVHLRDDDSEAPSI